MVTQEEIVLIKGKRSKRPRPPSPLALTMPTRSSDELLTRVGDEEEEKDMANCLMLLAKGQTKNYYRCKTCDKSFSSFQALGGHRASHTKSPSVINIKPPTTTTIIGNYNNKQDFFLPSSRDESTILSLQAPASRIGRVHECSICGTGFASGQALGGHMRRHRPLPLAAISGHGESGDQAKRLRTVLSLDLNLPAPEDNYDHDHQREEENKFNQQLIVFSASSLVNCHY